jgi:hypothetical protein
MISEEFDFAELIHALQDKDKEDILRLAEFEAIESEKICEEKGYGYDYVDAVSGLIYFLRFGQKPDSITNEQFQIFRNICEKLVAKNQLSPDVLTMFDFNQ